MADAWSTDPYAELGVRRVINARGNNTVLGGSSPSPEVLAAMEAANHHYVEMRELLEGSGRFIAGVLGTEAAYVTSGCAAALALSTAACIAGKEPDKLGRLPDTAGMPNGVVLQRAQRYAYDRCYTIAGGRLVLAGDEAGCSAAEMEAALDGGAVAAAYFARPDWGKAVLPLSDVVALAHARGLPVIVDAAAQIFPLDYFRSMAQSADLVCFGAKYFGAPHSTGVLCGRRDLVEAAAAHGFIAFENSTIRPFGRAFKVDRQEVVGAAAALKQWFSMDHESRLQGCESRISFLESRLRDVSGIALRRDAAQSAFGPALRIEVDPAVAGKTAAAAAEELSEGTPRVWAGLDGNALLVRVHTLAEGEPPVLAERLREVLSA